MTATGQALIERFRRARGDPADVVLEGFHALKHAVRFGATVERVCAPDAAPLMALAERLAPDLAGWLAERLELVPADLFERLSGRPPEPAVLAVARRPAPDLHTLLAAPRRAPLVLLEAPRHHGNLGAVVRVAAAAGAGAVLTTGPLDPWHPNALRGSAGLHFAVPVVRIHRLPESARPLLAIDPAGVPLRPNDIASDAVLAFGAERAGLGPELRGRATRMLALPMRPGVTSLPLPTAVASVLYAWRLSRPA